MNSGEIRHRPLPEETSPADAPQRGDETSDASAEVDQAAREIQCGSLRGEFQLLGQDIDTLLIRIGQEGGDSKHLQTELDELKQQHRLAMETMDQFASESAGEWNVFRTRMGQTQQGLRERLDAVRQRLPHAESINHLHNKEKS